MNLKSLLVSACLIASVSASASYPLYFRDTNNGNGHMEFPQNEDGTPAFNEDGSITLTRIEGEGVYFRTKELGTAGLEPTDKVANTGYCDPDYTVLAFEYKSDMPIDNVVIFYHDDYNYAYHTFGAMIVVTDEYQTCYAIMNRNNTTWGYGEGYERNHMWISFNNTEIGWELTVKNLRLLTLEEATEECKSSTASVVPDAFTCPNLDFVSDAIDYFDLYTKVGPNPFLSSARLLKPLPTGVTKFCFDYILWGTTFNANLDLVIPNAFTEAVTFTIESVAGIDKFDPDNILDNIPEWKTAKVELGDLMAANNFATPFGSMHHIYISAKNMTDGDILAIKNVRWVSSNPTVETKRLNRYLVATSPNNSTIYWTDGNGSPDRIWGAGGDFYTGTYNGVYGTFLRMSGTQTIRILAKADGMPDSEIVSVNFYEDMVSFEEPDITFSNDKLSVERDLNTWCVLAAVHDIKINGDSTNSENWNLDTKYAVFPPGTVASYNLKEDASGLWKEDDSYVSYNDMHYHMVEGKLPVHVLTFRSRPGQNIDPSAINLVTLPFVTDDVTINVREYGKAPMPKLVIDHLTLKDITDNGPIGYNIRLSTNGKEPNEQSETQQSGFKMNLEERDYQFRAMAIAPGCISSLPTNTLFFIASEHKLKTPKLYYNGVSLSSTTDSNATSTILIDAVTNEELDSIKSNKVYAFKDGLRLGKYVAQSSDSLNHYFPSLRSDEIEIHSIYYSESSEDDKKNNIILDGVEPLSALFSLSGVPTTGSIQGALAITGPLTEEDMNFLSSNTHNIDRLDLENVKWSQGNYPGGSIPASVRILRLGSNVSNLQKLPDSPLVMEIEWADTKDIPSRNVSFGDNNHILRVPTNYEGSLKYSPSWGHVVKGLDSNNLEMDSITFFDSIAFYNSEPFKAQKAIYARKFAKETPNPYDPNPDKCAGWETIILPFAVDTVVSGNQGFTPFGVGDNKAPHFWLYEASEEGWKPVTEIKADIPYLISFPLNKEYLPESMHDSESDILFIGNDVNVTATAKTEEKVFGLPAGNYFSGNFLLDSDASMRALNEEEKDGYPAGSWFFPDTPVYPFRAGIKGSSRRMMPVFGDWGQSGIQTLPDTPKNGMTIDTDGQRIIVRSSIDCNINIFDLTGALIEHIYVRSGETVYSRTLAPGIYIVNGRKVMIR